MKIAAIQNKYFNPKVTGYAASGGIALTILSGVSKNRTISKMHKPLAYVSLFLTLVHILLVEYNHYIYNHK